MKSVHIEQVPEEERKSPKSIYHLFQKNISLALGGKKDIGLWDNGQPFDLALVRVPAGCGNWPAHRHSTQWEMYYILEGEGSYFDGETWNDIRAGHAVLSQPGENHQIKNSGARDLIYLVIANMPMADSVFYPATGLTFLKPDRKFFKEVPVNYYDGHE
ncbi:MAG: cupin domain-containing protein [Limisphaerales bacterium]